MGLSKRIFWSLCFIIYYSRAFAADKYTDENRPYEFGFSIDGEQHRHEKKDENGIIMGEFGFITADGVYHVTVYATDAEGRFKILSMKNIRVKPYPGTSTVTVNSKATGIKKGHSLPFPPSENVVSTTEGVKQEKDKIFSPAKSCSHCSIPTTTSKPKPPNNSAYSTYTSTNTNYQGTQNTFSSPASGVYQGIQSQEPIKTEVDESQKTILGSDLSGLQKYNTQNTGRNYQDSQNDNQNQQGFVPVNSNKDSTDLTGFEQGLGINDNVYKNLQTPYLESKSQLTDTNSDKRQQFEDKQKNFQESGFERKPEEINDGQNNQQPTTALQNNRFSSDRNNGQDDTRLLSPVKINKNNEQQFPQDALPAVDNPNQNIGQNDEDTKLQRPAQNFFTPRTNTKEYNNQDSQSQLGTLSGERSPKQEYNNQDSQSQLGTLSGERSPKQYGSFGQTQSGDVQKPILITAQMQIVDKNTDIHHRAPGEVEGLPKGLSKGDMEHLLYTFNYTVGFHGHFEEGYTSGSKQGYYFVTGRNGVKTRIDYTADETGFHPKISQEVLDLLSDEVPKPETEKDEKYGLKGYEFKWLYYPVDSKRR